MMGIAWHEFDWQSFATLATGFAAVGAALIIGSRQTRIIEGQTEILEMQATLAETTLKHELFDRRYVVFEAAHHFLLYIMQHAQPPDQETEQRFLKGMHESRFLFRPQVHTHLDQIWRRSCDYGALKSEMARIYRDEGHYGADNPQKELEMFRELNAWFTGLVEFFSPEMRLSYIN